MDTSFVHHLKEKGVSDAAITALLNEDIHDMDTFVILKESHFAKLSERLSCSGSGRNIAVRFEMHLIT